MRFRRYAAVLAVSLVALAAAVLSGLLPRLAKQKALLAASKEDGERLPVVNVFETRRSPARGEIVLPGNVDPLLEAPIYARVDGYLRKLYVDIGDRVTAGQVLGDIESPELDQQLRQARASLTQTQAVLTQTEAQLELSRSNLAIAQLTVDRWKQLVARGVTSKQETDEKIAVFNARQADVNAAQATVNVAKSSIAASEANVQRLVEMQSFTHLKAPFNGIITVRNTTTGTLIQSGTESPNHELYRMAQIDTLRVFVFVPQMYAAAVQPGLPANLTVQQIPGRVFKGEVSRNANSLDASARTMKTEVRVQNPDHALLPGMYAEVRFQITRPHPPLVVPGDAIVSHGGVTQVATVDARHKVHYKKIVPGTDTGSEVEVQAGLVDGEMVVMNPTDDVREGATVDPKLAPKAAKQ